MSAALIGIMSLPASARPSNIIMAMADDTGWHGVGWHQSKACRADVNCHMQTPIMDALVSEGIELDQHYTYTFCSPTRSSLLTGRLPIHVNQQNNAEFPWTAAAIHPSFRTVADVLRDKAGYATHHFGKWHLGLARQEFTPSGRGFDTSIGYLSGSEFHFSHLKGTEVCKTGPDNCTGQCAVDFWGTNAPALGYQGDYSAHVYANETVKVIRATSAAGAEAKPFFVYLAFANTHAPLEAPESYMDLYPKTMQCSSRRMLGAMVSAMDEAMGNITGALKATELWNDTLIVFASDNGGPTGVGRVGPVAARCAANNYPLRGGKGNAWQGGVRTAAFVVGGVLPVVARGTRFAGYVHVADWFATFCNLAGIPGAASADDHTSPRPSDSIDMWPALTTPGQHSARDEIPLSIEMVGGPELGWRIENGALIAGRALNPL